MNPDPSYALPFELDKDTAQRIYFRRWLKVFRWGLYSLPISFLILLLRVIPFSLIYLALAVFLLYINRSSPHKPSDDDEVIIVRRPSDDDEVIIIRKQTKK